LGSASVDRLGPGSCKSDRGQIGSHDNDHVGRKSPSSVYHHVFAAIAAADESRGSQAR
jgi:hypothetical protein